MSTVFTGVAAAFLAILSFTAAGQVAPAAHVAVDTTGLLIKPSYVDVDAPIKKVVGHAICFHCPTPVFKGGHEELIRFLHQNLHWPDSLSRTAYGRVIVVFTVDEEGRVRDPAVLKGFHPLADNEVLGLARLLDGHFIPGKVGKDQPVATKYTLPISFGEQPLDKRKRK